MAKAAGLLTAKQEQAVRDLAYKVYRSGCEREGVQIELVQKRWPRYPFMLVSFPARPGGYPMGERVKLGTDQTDPQTVQERYAVAEALLWSEVERRRAERDGVPLSEYKAQAADIRTTAALLDWAAGELDGTLGRLTARMGVYHLAGVEADARKLRRRSQELQEQLGDLERYIQTRIAAEGQG